MGGRVLATSGRWKTTVLPVAFVLVAVALARAEPVMQVLRRLTPYDTAGERSFEALETLARAAREAEPATERVLPRFLHASASVDLWLIARVTHDTALEARLARALGVEVDALVQTLTAALDPLGTSQYGAMAMESAAAVRLVSGSSRPPSDPGVGSQLSLAFLHRVVTDLEGASNPVPELAHLGSDPCSDEAPCEGGYLHFDGQGRAAVQALERAMATWRRLDAQRTVDPLVLAVGSDLGRYREALAAVTLSPGPRLVGESTCEAGDCGAAARPDVIVRVDSTHVQVGFATRVRIDEHDELVYESAGQPAWPETQSLALPTDYPGYLRHLDSLVALLEPLHASATGESTIGVATSEGVPAHVWARVMLSARAAHFDELTALVRSPDGMARVQPMRLVTPFAASRLPPSDLDVILLHRGYTVKRRGTATTTIDRVAGADGEANFDVARLVKHAPPEHRRTAYLRFVPNVPADALLATAFALAPQEQPLTLILP